MISRQFDDGERREDLFNEVRAVFKSRTQSEWVELMRDADCCCEPVLSMAEAFEHAQTVAREMVRETGDPAAARLKQLGFSYKMSDTPPRTVLSAPALGEHTDDLLREIGISESERERLGKAGVIVIRE